MERKPVSTIWIAAFCIFLVGCAAEIIPETTQQSRPGSPANELIGPSRGCQPDHTLLTNLKAQLPYEELEIAAQSYSGEYILMVWIVDPTLEEFDQAERQVKAAQTATSASVLLDQASICVGKFDLLHFSVVGGDYYEWFSGPVRPGDIPGEFETGSGGIPQSERGAGVESNPQVPAEPSDENSCSWDMVRDALEQGFSEKSIQAGFTYVRNESGNIVSVHWVIPAEQDPTDDLNLLELVVDELRCLYPPATGISVMVVDDASVIQLTGFLPADEGDFDLADFKYQLISEP